MATVDIKVSAAVVAMILRVKYEESKADHEKSIEETKRFHEKIERLKIQEALGYYAPPSITHDVAISILQGRGDDWALMSLESHFLKFTNSLVDIMFHEFKWSELLRHAESLPPETMLILSVDEYLGVYGAN